MQQRIGLAKWKTESPPPPPRPNDKMTLSVSANRTDGSFQKSLSADVADDFILAGDSGKFGDEVIRKEWKKISFSDASHQKLPTLGHCNDIHEAPVTQNQELGTLTNTTPIPHHHRTPSQTPSPSTPPPPPPHVTHSLWLTRSAVTATGFS